MNVLVWLGLTVPIARMLYEAGVSRLSVREEEVDLAVREDLEVQSTEMESKPSASLEIEELLLNTILMETMVDQKDKDMFKSMYVLRKYFGGYFGSKTEGKSQTFRVPLMDFVVGSAYHLIVFKCGWVKAEKFTSR